MSLCNTFNSTARHILQGLGKFGDSCVLILFYQNLLHRFSFLSEPLQQFFSFIYVCESFFSGGFIWADASDWVVSGICRSHTEKFAVSGASLLQGTLIPLVSFPLSPFMQKQPGKFKNCPWSYLLVCPIFVEKHQTVTSNSGRVREEAGGLWGRAPDAVRVQCWSQEEMLGRCHSECVWWRQQPSQAPISAARLQSVNLLESSWNNWKSEFLDQ